MSSNPHPITGAPTEYTEGATPPASRIVYGYDRDTGEYMGEAAADPSPLEPGVYLLPACTTEMAPPAAGEKAARVFLANTWAQMPDHRGETWWTADGVEARITALGNPGAQGLLAERPDLPLPVPAVVTRTQALLALARLTPPILRSQIVATIAAIPDEIQREQAEILYEGPTWRRDDAFIALLAPQFGLAGGDLDDLFRVAATL